MARMFIVIALALLATSAMSSDNPFEGTGPDPVAPYPQGWLTIKYTDPERAGQTVTITITDGFENEVDEVAIHLDEAGSGQTGWHVAEECEEYVLCRDQQGHGTSILVREPT